MMENIRYKQIRLLKGQSQDKNKNHIAIHFQYQRLEKLIKQAQKCFKVIPIRKKQCIDLIACWQEIMQPG